MAYKTPSYVKEKAVDGEELTFMAPAAALIAVLIIIAVFIPSPAH
jgi:hypothetical protein